MVMVDFIDAKPSLSEAAAMRKCIDGLKAEYLTRWLENELKLWNVGKVGSDYSNGESGSFLFSFPSS